MASPHVAGVVALMQSARIAAGKLPLTPLEFDQLMQSERLSTDLGSAGRDDQFGYGLINANLAVQAALDFDLDPPPPQLAATPTVIEFRADLDASGITLSNVGGGELDVTGVTEWPEVMWLDIEPSQSVDPSGLGAYLLHVDRAGLAEGDYTATIRIESSANNIDVLVNMSVSANAFAGDVGDIVVLLFDEENIFQAQEVLVVSSTNGAFEFTNIASDCYLVAASTDIDNDFVIAEVGEAWGAYVSKFNQTPLILDSDAVNIDIEVSFDRLEALPTDNRLEYSPVEQQSYGID
jgi:serine protease